MSDRLLWMVKNGEAVQVVELLKTTDLNVNEHLVGGRNALHHAADYGHVDVIQCLLDAGADIDMLDKHGISPLLAAVYENHTDAVKFLISKGANKNVKSPSGEGLIDCAETDDMKFLLKN